MATVNKFNIYWQVVRTKVRDIKDVDAKIKYVMDFLNKHKNVHNYGRVHNWIKMTGVAYKGEQRQAFEDALAALEKNQSKYNEGQDLENDLSKVDRSELELVYKDLSKRKYGFQYKTVPKAHIEFMDALKTELDRR